MKKLLSIFLTIVLMATMSVTAFAEETTPNIILELTDSWGDGWETATIKACLVKSDGSEEILREGMTVAASEATYEFTVDKFAVVRFYWVGTEEYAGECGVTIKRDGNIQYEQIGYEEITDGALICSSEYFDPRSTTVTYNVAPTYTVTIPTDVTIDGNSTTISAENVVVEKGKYVSVTLADDNDFTVKTAQGAELDYTVTANGEAVAAGGEILAVNPTDGKTGSATVTFAIDEAAIKYAGTYTGTATFTVAVKDVPKTIINFTIDGETFEAEEGMTWAEWVDSASNTIGLYVSNSADGVCWDWYCLFDATDAVKASDVIEAEAYTLVQTEC